MAKISYSKLKIKQKEEPIIVAFNNNNIEIKKNLPIVEKMKLVENVLNDSMDDKHYYNPLKIKMLFTLQVLFNYTNINFTDKQKENLDKLYDEVYTSGLFDIITAPIEKEIDDLYNDLWDTIDSVYKYLNSVYGTIENMQGEYNGAEMDIQKLFNDVKDPEQLAFLKEVLDKMG